MNVHQALAQVMRDVSAVGKNQRNREQNFNFRGIDDVYNEVHPLLAKHGLIMCPEVTQASYSERATKSGGMLQVTRLLVRYHVWADDGSTMTIGPVAAEGMDSGDKSASKAMAMGHKYALFQTLLLPTADSDPDGDSPGQEDPPQPGTNKMPNGKPAPAPDRPSPGVDPKDILPAIGDHPAVLALHPMQAWSRREIGAYIEDVGGGHRPKMLEILQACVPNATNVSGLPDSQLPRLRLGLAILRLHKGVLAEAKAWCQVATQGHVSWVTDEIEGVSGRACKINDTQDCAPIWRVLMSMQKAKTVTTQTPTGSNTEGNEETPF